MVGPAITLLLLLFLKGYQSEECPDSTHHVVGLSGAPLRLRPSNTQTEIHSVKWKMQLRSYPETYVILTWKNSSGLKYEALASEHFNRTLDFQTKDLTLLIKAAKPQDSGHYQLEVTKESGKVCLVHFKVFVFDHVEQPLLQGQWKALDERKCQLALSCLVSRDGNVNYTWYRSNELISTLRNLTYLEVQVDANDLHTYTCNVSNPVSWASHTLNLTQGCLHALPRPRFLPFVVIVTILVTLFLITLTCFCVWKRKRKQSQTSPEALLTIYEDIKDPQMRRNEEPKFLQEGSTIYSMIEFQSSSSTPKEATNTLYSFIQPSRKSRVKDRNKDPSSNCSIYEEVGMRHSRAHNSARLSRKELKSFDIYS